MAYILDEKKAVALLIKHKIEIEELLSTAKKPVSQKKQKGTCKYCTQEGLYWTETPKGWRLLDDNNNQHKCANYKARK